MKLRIRKTLRKYITNVISFSNSVSGNTFRDRSSEFFVGDVTPELQELMRRVWQPVVGPNCTVLIFRFKRPQNTRTLGISVTGITQTFQHDRLNVSDEFRASLIDQAFSQLGTASELQYAPQELCHFIDYIQPNGFIDQLKIAQQGDEVLQVNGRRIRGFSHTTAIRSLRQLPDNIELVLSRRNSPIGAAGDFTDNLAGGEACTLEVAGSDVGTEFTASGSGSAHNNRLTNGKTPSPVVTAARQDRVSDWVRRSIIQAPSGSDGGDRLVSPGLAYEKSDASPLPMEANPSNLSYPANYGQLPGADDFQPSGVPVQHPLPSHPATSYRGGASQTLPHHRQRLVHTPSSVSDHRLLQANSLARTHDRPPSGTLRLGTRPVWSDTPFLVQLEKSSGGFGFSVAEYEPSDELDTGSPDKSGVLPANRRNRSLSGSRIRLRRSSTISGGGGVGSAATLARRKRSMSRSRNGLLLIDCVMPDGAAAKDGRIAVGDRLLFVNDRNLAKASYREALSVLRSAPQGPCLLGISKVRIEPIGFDSLLSEVASRVSVAAVNETAAVNGSPYPATPPPLPPQDSFELDHPLDFNVLPCPGDSELHSPDLKVAPIDPGKEKTARLNLNFMPIGIKLDALAAGGQDGCRVIEVVPGGAVANSCLLKVNDYITRLDQQSMRGLANLEVFQTLCGLSKNKTIIEIAYIPAAVVERHRTRELQSSRSKKTPLRCESVVLIRHPDESAWGMRLAGSYDHLHQQMAKDVSGLERPTFITKLVTNSPAERCGILQVGDLILTLQDMDVSNLGPDRISDFLVRSIQEEQLLKLRLGVHFSASGDPTSDVRHTLVSVDVERRLSGKQERTADSPPPAAATVALLCEGRKLSQLAVQVNESVDLADHVTSQYANLPCPGPGGTISSASSSSSAPTPGPLTELDTRDELNVLSRQLVSSPPPPPLAESAARQSWQHSHRPPQHYVFAYTGYSSEETNGQFTTSPSGPHVREEEETCESDRASSSPPPPPARPTSRRTTASISSPDLQPPTAYSFPSHSNSHPDDEIVRVHVPIPRSSLTETEGELQHREVEAAFNKLGIRLVTAGNNRADMAVATFVAGFRADATVARISGLQVGDQIIQVEDESVLSDDRQGTVEAVISRAILKADNRYRLDQLKANGQEQQPPVAAPYISILVRRNPANLSLIKAVSCHLPVPQSLLDELHAQAPKLTSQMEIFDVTITRLADGFGLFLVNVGADNKLGVFISRLLPNQAASKQTDLQEADRILAVNGQPVLIDYDMALQLVKQSPVTVRLTIARLNPSSTPAPAKAVDDSDLSPRRAPVATSSPHNNGPVQSAGEGSVASGIRSLGEEILIELRRDRPQAKFGFTIVGSGISREENTWVYVHQIESGQTADLDGRLRVGDRLLSVNGTDVRNSSHLFVQSLISSLPSWDTLKLVVFREHQPCPTDNPLVDDAEEGKRELEILLVRETPDQSLGFSLVSRAPYSAGMAVGQVAVNSLAYRAGLYTGDVLLSLNDQDVRCYRVQDVTSLLASNSRVKLLVFRSHSPEQEPRLPVHRLKVYAVILSRYAPVGFNTAAAAVFGEHTFGLGLREATSEELDQVPGRLVVERLFPDSPAAFSSMIMVGDRLLSVDREPLDWLSLADVAHLLSSLPVCNLELGRPVYPPAPCLLDPTDVWLPTLPSQEIAAAQLESPNPPYPPSHSGGLLMLSLPEVLVDGEMPCEIETPQCVREMNTLEEEEDSGLLGFRCPEVPPDDQPPSARVEEQPPVPLPMQERHGGFHIRHISLPLASEDQQSRSLGLQLADGRGISGPSVTSVQPGSPAQLAGLRVGDRLLAVNSQLVLALGTRGVKAGGVSPPSAQQILVTIEKEWLARTGPDPVYVTLISKVMPEEDYYEELVVLQQKETSRNNGLQNGDCSSSEMPQANSNSSTSASYFPKKSIMNGRPSASQLTTFPNVEITNGDNVCRMNGPSDNGSNNYESSDRQNEVVIVSNGVDCH